MAVYIIDNRKTNIFSVLALILDIWDLWSKIKLLNKNISIPLDLYFGISVIKVIVL